MANATFSAHGAAETGFFPFFQATKNVLAGLFEGFDAYQRYQTLSAMSSTQLKEMGLARQDIARAAMFPASPKF